MNPDSLIGPYFLVGKYFNNGLGTVKFKLCQIDFIGVTPAVDVLTLFLAVIY